MTIPTKYYVSAIVGADGLASCTYFEDKGAANPVSGTLLTIPFGQSSCVIEQTDQSQLSLLAVSFKTLGQPPKMRNTNFAPATDDGAVEVPMPPDEPVTKGLVLLFSNPGKVDALYPSSDPELTNSGSNF